MQQGTPLRYAAFSGHSEVVEALIAAGVDIHARDVSIPELICNTKFARLHAHY